MLLRVMAARGWNPMRMLRVVLVEGINAMDASQITSLCENEVAMIEWQRRAVVEVRRRLRELGLVELMADRVWNENKLIHQCQSVLGNSTKMYFDTRDKDLSVDFTKFQLWDTRWRIEHDKAQCSKDLASTSSLPKCMRIA